MSEDIVDLLKRQAIEIAKEGWRGWGNTMLEAAEKIEFLRRNIETLQNNMLSDEIARQELE